MTVVIPAWDSHVRFLHEAVGMALAQEGPPVQVLILDNASTVPVAVPDTPSVTVLRAPRRLGVGEVRNWALGHVVTPYVLWCDADDLVIPGTLAHLHTALSAAPDAVAAMSAHVGWNPETGEEVLWPFPRDWAYRIAARRRLLVAATLLVNAFPTVGGTLMRTAAVRDSPGFLPGIEYGEEWSLAYSLAVRGRVLMSRRPGLRRRIHPASLSSRDLNSSARRDGRTPAAMRLHVRRDPATPAWARLALHPAALYHRYKRWQTRRVHKNPLYARVLAGSDADEHGA